MGGAGELIADIDAEPAAIVQCTVALTPDEIQMVDILFIAVAESKLFLAPVVLQLPVGW